MSFDPNVRPLLMGERATVLERVEAALAVADVVKASEEDVAWLLPGEDVAAVAADWASRGPALVVVTRGPHGALAVTSAGVEVRRPARQVDVVDTVGAGDSFTGALLAGLLRRDLLGAARREALHSLGADVLADVVDEAALVSAITCSRLGADPPSAAELSAYAGWLT